MKPRVIRLTLAVVVAAYITFCSHFWFWQEWYLVEPKKDPTDMSLSKYKGKGISFILPNVQGDTREIHYRKYLTGASPVNGTVFYLHGNRGDMDRCEFEIDFLLDRGYDVWTMDYRGFGNSNGTMSEQALREDAFHVFRQINSRVSSQQVIIWGRSFGSGVAASVAASAGDKCELLVLETPYWSLIDLAQQRCPIIPRFIFRYELPIHEFLSSVSCPVHLIHGTQDEKIDDNSSGRLLEFCRSRSITAKGHSIMGGLHNLRHERTAADFDEKVASFLK